LVPGTSPYREIADALDEVPGAGSEACDAHAVATAGGLWTIIDRFRDDVAGIADVTDGEPGPAVRSLELRPRNPEGAAVRLYVLESEVLVIIGESSRFELGFDEPDRRLLAGLLDAARAGRVREVSDMFGTAYAVRLSDGSEKVGRVVQIRWRGRGTRDYAPWDVPG
jgi:hypothetical protein